jgi:hypothetical protein
MHATQRKGATAQRGEEGTTGAVSSAELILSPLFLGVFALKPTSFI